MASKHICPKCGFTEFFTTVHVAEEWLVDEYGEFIDVSKECIEVDVEPDDGNLWFCAKCGAEAEIMAE